jgi:hypothetical protein
MTYYDKEFQKLNNSDNSILKIIGRHGETRWLTVTPDEIEQILQVLNKKEETETE